MGHVCKVDLVDTAVEMLGDRVHQLLAKFQKVVFFKLLNFVCALDVVGITRRLYREGVNQLEISMDAETRAVSFVLFIPELAIIEQKVRTSVVEDHRESLDHLLLLWVFNLRAEHEDGSLS